MCSGYEENWKQEMNRRRRMLVLEILRRSRSEGNALAQEQAGRERTGAGAGQKGMH